MMFTSDFAFFNFANLFFFAIFAITIRLQY